MALSNIRMWVLAGGALAVVLLNRATTPAQATSFTVSYFDTISPVGADDGLHSLISADVDDVREAVEAIRVRMTQVLCLTECTLEASLDLLTDFILSLLNLALVSFATCTPTWLFPADVEAASPTSDIPSSP